MKRAEVLKKCIALGFICSISSGYVALAEDTTSQKAETYTLDPVVVTAQRMETKEAKTPAAIEVFSEEKLKETGATNLQDALKYGTGLYYQSQGRKGTSMGAMTNKVVIRGVEKGSLILLDGVPLNQSGRYNLEDIPVDTIEKVEVIRGGGAVLYGSEATGGVINIITKKERKNTVHAAFGNYGMQNHGVSIQMGKLGFTYSYDKMGKAEKMTDPNTKASRGGAPKGSYYDLGSSERHNFSWRYDFNDNFFITNNFGRSTSNYINRYNGVDRPANAGAIYKYSHYVTRHNDTQLHYTNDNKDLSAIAFYNDHKLTTKSKATTVTPNKRNFNPNKWKPETSDTSHNISYGFDTNKRWQLGNNSALIGFAFTKDRLENKNTYSRNVWGLYGQYALNISATDSLNINSRYTWTTNATADRNYHKYVPEVEYSHKFGDNTMLYAKAGKSFMLPTFSQIYGTGTIIPNADLKPQSGTHYEIGIKHNVGNQAWRLAIFNYKIVDSIEAKFDGTPALNVKYENEDVKNTGIELTHDVKVNDNWQYNWGVSYSHPQKRSGKDVNGHNYTYEGWHDYYGKLQFNGGVRYTKNKFTAALNFNYLGKRVRDLAGSPTMRPYLFTDLNLSYRPNEDSRVYVNIDNLLNRRDITTSSSSSFYTLGRNVMVGYEYTF